MKNIALLMPYGSVGGMERLALSMYHFYKREGYKVIGIKIIGLDNDLISFGADEFVLSRKDFSDYSKVGRLRLYAGIPRRLKEIITREEIDYTISFGDMANCFSALCKTGERKIASIHALKSVEMRFESFMNKAFALAYRTIYKRFYKVVCISEDIKNDLLEQFRYKHGNLEVIYNPHDFKRIEQLSEEFIEDAFERDIFESNNVILFIGRLSMQKSPWYLVNAFSCLNRSYYKLVFIGDGDPVVESFLKGQVNHYGLQDNVFFWGRKENPYKYLKKASVLALSSLYEGTPNVIVEAMVLEIPIVTSNCTDGIMEIMRVNKQEQVNNWWITEAGIVTPSFFEGSMDFPEKVEVSKRERSFANALIYTIENRNMLYQSFIENKQILLKKFSLSKACLQYLNG